MNHEEVAQIKPEIKYMRLSQYGRVLCESRDSTFLFDLVIVIIVGALTRLILFRSSEEHLIHRI